MLAAMGLGRQVEGRWLWRGLIFDLAAGDCVGLVAPSGAGKTVLLRSLVWLDPLQQGEVWFEGRSLTDWALPVYRTQVMYLPQRPAVIEGSVADNLQQPFTLAQHRHRRYQAERILSWLDDLGRGPDFLTLKSAQLSGGELQLLALLRALQLDPKILLLDEPTASLDPATTAQVEALLGQWLQTSPRAVMITSHDPSQIDRFTHRKLVLEAMPHG